MFNQYQIVNILHSSKNMSLIEGGLDCQNVFKFQAKNLHRFNFHKIKLKSFFPIPHGNRANNFQKKYVFVQYFVMISYSALHREWTKIARHMASV